MDEAEINGWYYSMIEEVFYSKKGKVFCILEEDKFILQVKKNVYGTLEVDLIPSIGNYRETEEKIKKAIAEKKIKIV